MTKEPDMRTYELNANSDHTSLVSNLSVSFEDILELFENSPSQQKVIRMLLEHGFSVNSEGKVVSGGIEIPDAAIARELDVGRNVVNLATNSVLENDQLRPIFQNISHERSLIDLAPILDLTVIIISIKVSDTDQHGIISTFSSMLAEEEISIRQFTNDDPEFTDEPKLYIVTNDELPGHLIKEFNDNQFVKYVKII
jgi:predicted regulator of amino acid metabolism with ACT domain